MADCTVKQTGMVYSNDQKIYEGMTTKDASKDVELMKAFNYADKDGDGKISSQELLRYNGPVFRENGDFYPGLQVEHVGKGARETFVKIDMNKDGVLSKEEISVANEIKNEAQNIIRRMKKLRCDIESHNWDDNGKINKKEKRAGIGIISGMFGIGSVGGIMAALGSDLSKKAIKYGVAGLAVSTAALLTMVCVTDNKFLNMKKDAREDKIDELAEKYAEENADPINAARNGYIDNVIEPQFVRAYVISALQTLWGNKIWRLICYLRLLKMQD